jgi:hypothetical protein
MCIEKVNKTRDFENLVAHYKSKFGLCQHGWLSKLSLFEH